MSLHRCTQCSATLKPAEAECYACGTVVLHGDDPKALFAKRFSKGITVLFFLSSAFTLASLFLDSMPPFVDCAAITGILGLVRSSAGQMTERHGRG